MSNDELTVFQLYSLLGSQFFTLPSSFVGDCLFWAVFDYNFKKKKKGGNEKLPPYDDDILIRRLNKKRSSSDFDIVKILKKLMILIKCTSERLF